MARLLPGRVRSSCVPGRAARASWRSWLAAEQRSRRRAGRRRRSLTSPRMAPAPRLPAGTGAALCANDRQSSRASGVAHKRVARWPPLKGRLTMRPVPRPREQSGALSEASRLLQEGLQLLDDRTREVDALLQGAREEARRLTYDAQKGAEEITAEAERERAELEQQVAVLRSEVARVREELAQLRAAPQKAESGGSAPGVTEMAPPTVGASSLGPGLVALEAEPSGAESFVPTLAAPVAETGEAEPFGPSLDAPVAPAHTAEAEPVAAAHAAEDEPVAAAQAAEADPVAA